MSYRGRATLDRTRPKAVGECDRCGFVWNRNALQPQLRYAGNAIVDTGWRVCPPCLDPLDRQDTPKIPQPDGLPIPDPRPINRSS